MKHIDPSDFERLQPDLSDAARTLLADRADVGRLTASDVFDLNGIEDWDRVLLLIWPGLIGADALQGLVDAVAGLEPCCKDCIGKDTPEKRRTFKGAYHALRCHLRQQGEHRDRRVGVILAGLRAILEAQPVH